MDKKLRKAIIDSQKSIYNKSKVKKIIKKGLYEVIYTMVGDHERGEAYWIRYTLVCPKSSKALQEGQGVDDWIDSLGGDGMLWLGFFDANNSSNNFMIKKRFPLSSVEGSKELGGDKYSVFKVNDAEIFLDGMKGGFETQSGRKVSWDLKFSHFMNPYIMTPDIAKKLGISNTVAKGTHPNLRIMGNITVDGNSKDMKDASGIQYHTLGDGYLVPWSWLSCHTLKGVPDGFLDFGAKPGKATVELFDGKRSITSWNAKTMKRLKVMKIINNTKSLTKVGFDVDFKEVSLEGEITVPKEALIGVEYVGPLGNSFYCYNSEVADCKVKYKIKNPDGTIKEEGEFTGEKSVSFETVYDKPQEGIEYLPWDKEEL